VVNKGVQKNVDEQKKNWVGEDLLPRRRGRRNLIPQEDTFRSLVKESAGHKWFEDILPSRRTVRGGMMIKGGGPWQKTIRKTGFLGVV